MPLFVTQADFGKTVLLLGVVGDIGSHLIEQAGQSGFREVIGLQKIVVMSKQVTTQPSLLIDHKAQQKPALRKHYVGVVNPILSFGQAMNLQLEDDGDQESDKQGN
jgi:hypothetical protein